MKLSEIKTHLSSLERISFKLPNGEYVSGHFHVTEVGKVDKDFIDCGGNRRTESLAVFQLWEANDYDHRLHPEKLVHIIELSQSKLEMGDREIEVEYQGETIGKYSLGIENGEFTLNSKKTACLANEACGVPTAIPVVGNSCAPGSGCC